MKVEIRMTLDIDDEFWFKLTKIADNNIKTLMNLDSYPEIKSVSNVMLVVQGKDNENGKEQE